MKKFTEALIPYVGKKVVVYLMNGFQMKGTITEVYEDGGIRLNDSEFQYPSTIAGHAISTVREF